MTTLRHTCLSHENYTPEMIEAAGIRMTSSTSVSEVTKAIREQLTDDERLGVPGVCRMYYSKTRPPGFDWVSAP